VIFNIRKARRKIRLGVKFLNNGLFRLNGRAVKPRTFADLSDIRNALASRKPFAAGKIGGTELRALEYWDRRLRFEWPPARGWIRPAERLMLLSGFFPIEKGHFTSWQNITTQAISEMDFLCAWQTDPFFEQYEQLLINKLAPSSFNFFLRNLGRPLIPILLPFKWLVVSPFSLSVERQLPKLREIHDPDFVQDGEWNYPAQTCQVVRCPFYSHLEKSPYASWLDGLEKMSKEILAKQFDVALIGAGAWSLPLAARIKDSGRSAIHMGGETQLIFGIRGKRWDNYSIYNKSWVSPDDSEMPQKRERVEDGCYW
jgi:hypothetical protein